MRYVVSKDQKSGTAYEYIEKFGKEQ